MLTNVVIVFYALVVLNVQCFCCGFSRVLCYLNPGGVYVLSVTPVILQSHDSLKQLLFTHS